MGKKKPIISPFGQWAYPGEVTIIPSSDITMKGVNYPVLGIDDLGNQQMMMPGQDYKFPGNYVTEIPQMGKGGLRQWFAEEWTDVKTGKPCGRSGKDKDGRPYPACRPSKRVNETTPKTTSEMSSAEKDKFKREKTSGKRIDYNHKRREFGGESWLNQYQDGGTEQNPERMQGVDIKRKRKNVSDSPKYQYDNKGNLLYTPELNIYPYLSDNSSRDSFWVTPKIPIQNLNPTVEELRTVAAPYYPIDNKLVSDPKLTFKYSEAKPSNYQESLEQEYVLPQMVGKSFGNLPLVKDDGYSPNRRWITSLRNGDKLPTGYRYNSGLNLYGSNNYAYVLKTDPNNLVNYSTKDKIENDLSLNDKALYDYLAKINYSPDNVYGLTRELPDQIWNRAEQMRVEMRNNPEIMSWANLHNVDLGYKERYEDSEDNDDFAPKIPESIYAARLAEAGLPTNRPDYDYGDYETYIAQDPSKFNLVDYFPVAPFLKDARNNEETNDQALKKKMAKRMGIDPSAFDSGEYLIHYNKTPITEYTPGKKYGGWLDQFQVGGRAPIYTSNPNDPRIGRYNDSLNLYKKGEQDKQKYINVVRNAGLSTNRLVTGPPAYKTSSKIAPISEMGLDSRGGDRNITLYERAPGPAKLDRSNLNLRGDAEISNTSALGKYLIDRAPLLYKKPVQPYVYKKSIAPPIKKSVLSIESEAPPIYTSDLNDLRLRAYNDSLNSYNLAPLYNKQILTNLQKATTVKGGFQANLKTNEEFEKRGLNYQLGFNRKEFPRKTVSDGYVGAIKYEYKKPVQPYIYRKPEVTPEVVETPLPVAPIEQPVKKIGYTQPIIQQFNYMSNENKAKALQKYGSVSDIPFQGVDINQLKDGGWLDEFQVGGTLPPIYTSNPRDPRIRNYQDSLNLYKEQNRLNILNDKTNYPQQSARPTINKNNLIYTGDPNKGGYVNPKIFSSNIPTLSKDIHGNLKQQYKKPVQPVIYKKPEVSPIYTSDRNDPRLRAYNDSLSLHKLNMPPSIFNSTLKEIKTNPNFRYYRPSTKAELNSFTGKIKPIGGTEFDFKKLNSDLITGKNTKYSYYPFRDKEGKVIPNVIGTHYSFKKPVQPYIYKKAEVTPEVIETPVAPAPVVEPPKPSLFVSNIDRDMYTPGGGMGREYNIGITLQDGSKKAFRTEKEYQDWKATNNLDISNAKVTEGKGYSYDYPENKKYGGWLDQFQTGSEVPSDIERMDPAVIKRKRSWFDKLKGYIHRGEKAIGLDPYNERSDDMFSTGYFGGKEGLIPDEFTDNKPTLRQLKTYASLYSPKNWVATENSFEPLTNYNEYNSFDEAFTNARKKLGRGKSFLYDGKRHITSYKGEAPDEESDMILEILKGNLSKEQQKRLDDVYTNAGQPPLSFNRDDEKFYVPGLNTGLAFSNFTIPNHGYTPHVNLISRNTPVYLGIPEGEINDIRDVLLHELSHNMQVRRDGTGVSVARFLTDASLGKLGNFNPYARPTMFEGEAHSVIAPKLKKYVEQGNKFQTGGWANFVPASSTPLLRKDVSGNAGYRDNTRVNTINPATKKAAEAAQYARRVGSISQGKTKSDYEKAREASSFVSQAEQRKGSADPLDYVLDMVNPAFLPFAGIDLVGNTGSAVSNVAQGNFAEAGSDLLNAGINALQVIPAAAELRGPLRSTLKSRMSGIKPSIQNSVDNIATPNISQNAFIPPVSWQAQELPGLHLKSTMTNGPISKIVEPKTGLINVEQALGIIGKESGGVDKVALIKQGLGENIPKKMDYNDFRKTVQDQLIPLEKQFSTERSDYGIDRLGYAPGKFVTKEVGGKKIHTYESDYLDNQTILFSNKDKFGRGSGAHGNPDETLGHAHYLIDKESPDVLTITQIQSDAFQGTHRSMPKNIDDAVSKLNKTQANSDDVLELMGDEKEKFKSVFDNADRKLQLDKATVENFTQKSLLDKNHQERYLQELVDYAGKQDYLNKVRVPTSETAAKVQGYRPVTTAEEIIEKYNKLKGTPEWDEIMADTPDADKLRLQKVLEGKIKGDIYDLERTTILKKYSEQPKTIKKLFGEEPKLVTDSKGNTWYEFDIPKKFKEGKGEIKAFSTIGGIGVAGAAASQLQEQKQGGQTNWLNKYK